VEDVMGLAANHATIAAPMQGLTEISLGVLLVMGLLTGRRNCRFSVSRQPLDFRVGYLLDLELLVPMLASLGLAIGGAGRRWALTPGCRNGGHLLGGGDWGLVHWNNVHLDHDHVRVSVIIPTHNEAQSIALVLADLPSDLTTEVIVVDSNSNDGHPRSPQEWEPAWFRKRAEAMGERASPVWPRQTPRTWLCSWMATTAIGPPNCQFF